MIAPVPPSVGIVRICAGPLAAITALSGLLLVLPAPRRAEHATRGRLVRAGGVASVYGCALGLCAGLLATGGIAYLDRAVSERPFEYAVAFVLVCGILAWGLAILGSIGAAYAAAAGEVAKPPIEWAFLVVWAGVVVVVGLLLHIRPVTVDSVNRFIAPWPFGCIGFASRLRWWAGNQIRRHQGLCGAGLILIGALLAASVYGLDLAARP